MDKAVSQVYKTIVLQCKNDEKFRRFWVKVRRLVRQIVFYPPKCFLYRDMRVSVVIIYMYLVYVFFFLPTSAVSLTKFRVDAHLSKLRNTPVARCQQFFQESTPSQ